MKFPRNSASLLAKVQQGEKESRVSPILPKTIPQMIADSSGGDLRLQQYSDEDVMAIVKCTTGQSANSEWKKHRVGRITASNIRRVLTKMDTVNNPTSKRSKDTDKLVADLCSKDCKPPTPQMKYGLLIEPIARKHYGEKLQNKGHVNVTVKETGLFVCKEHVYLAASPDGIVECDCCGRGLVKMSLSQGRTKRSRSEGRRLY